MAISKKMEIPIYNKLIRHWRDLNYDIDFGPSKEEDILAIEAKYDITLPDDFRTYLLKACPKPHGGEMDENYVSCLLYTSPSPRDGLLSRMPSSA